LGLALCAQAASGEPGSAPDDYTTDARGRRFRVRFDPGNQASLGVELAGRTAPDAEAVATVGVHGGIWLRSETLSGDGDEVVRWQVDHHLFSGRATPPQTQGDGASGWEADARLYRGLYRRHTASPYMVLPSSPPRRIFFPFDLGLATELGRLVRRTGAVPAPSGSERMEIGVAGASLLLDAWRSGRSGRSLELGIGASYRVDLEPEPGADEGQRVVHRVAPFTATSLRLEVEFGGRSRLEVAAEAVPHWASEGDWHLSTEAEASWAHVFVAANDEPLWTVVRVAHRRSPPGPNSPASQELLLSLGLTLGWQLR